MMPLRTFMLAVPVAIVFAAPAAQALDVRHATVLREAMLNAQADQTVLDTLGEEGASPDVVSDLAAAQQCAGDAACLESVCVYGQLNASELAAVKDELDSMSEMGEMESLRLQMAMDRMSKLMSTLSNVLKKISDTAQGITQNIK
jgi:hypothetical protein